MNETLRITLIVVLVILAIFCAFMMFETERRKAEKEKEEEMRRRWQKKAQAKKEEEALELKRQQYYEKIAELTNRVGDADIVISINEYDIDGEIRAYQHRRKIVIMGKEYDFTQVLQCQYSDNIRTEKGTTTITSQGTTKTNTGSMIGRAVVGGVLTGGVGAIIGGATASKGTTTTSVVQQGADITKHDYTVWIYIKDIANPMIQIHIGSDGAKVNEILALMKAIIAN